MEELRRGAEAVLYREDGKVIKRRVPKGYRLRQIDDSIRGFRTRREAKVLEKLEEIQVSAPRLLGCDDEETVYMEFIDGDILSVSLKPESMEEVGVMVGKLHDSGIIHGDLTTSNMILKDKIHLIDFGLSFFSEKVEDKAVDINLLYEALGARHFDVFDECVENFEKGYKKSRDFKAVMKRLEKVESRGRYKKKGDSR